MHVFNWHPFACMQDEPPVAQYAVRSWDDDSEQRAFPYPQPMDPVTQRLTAIPLGLLYPAMAVAVGASALAGSVPGRLIPGGDSLACCAGLPHASLCMSIA